MHSNHAQRHCRHLRYQPWKLPSPARRMRSWSTYQTNLQAACAANPSIMRLLIGPEDYLLADSRSSQLEPSAHSMHPLPSQGRTSYYGHTIPMICRRVGRCATDWCSLMPHPCRLCPPARPPIPPVGSGAHKHQRARGPSTRLRRCPDPQKLLSGPQNRPIWPIHAKDAPRRAQPTQGRARRSGPS